MSSDPTIPQLNNNNVVCLAGGVGGAKLADGLAMVVPPEQLTIVVNNGDDFQHLGLDICPDLDTVCYTLAGVANPETGWGRQGESWATIEETARLGGADWFRLGDLDLATHLVRSSMLQEGKSLTAVTRHLTEHLGIKVDILPMTDQPAPTMIASGDELLPFQTWFVKERWQPPVSEVCLPEDIRATPQVMAALEKADIIVFAPSNPFVSIDPILNVFPIWGQVMDLPKAVVAVSPIIGGKALKGPAAKMMAEMGLPVTAAAVADHYGDLIDGYVYDQLDEKIDEDLNCAMLQAQTIMKTAVDRENLAVEVLQFALKLASRVS